MGFGILDNRQFCIWTVDSDACCLGSAWGGGVGGMHTWVWVSVPPCLSSCLPPSHLPVLACPSLPHAGLPTSLLPSACLSAYLYHYHSQCHYATPPSFILCITPPMCLFCLPPWSLPAMPAFFSLPTTTWVATTLLPPTTTTTMPATACLSPACRCHTCHHCYLFFTSTHTAVCYYLYHICCLPALVYLLPFYMIELDLVVMPCCLQFLR